MASERTDPELVLAIASGDRESLALLYERYGGLLLAVGIRMLGERREAEDVLHDVFLEVWRKADDFSRARGTVRTWLLLRMRSRVRDRIKSAAYSRSAPLESRPEPADQGLQAALERRSERTRLAVAVEALSSEQRRVLELAYFSGLSSSEISDEEGIPIGTVKSRMRAALKKLRSQLVTASGEFAP